MAWYDDPNETQADYWLAAGGLWRTARTDKQCDAWNLEQRGHRCQRSIKAGERYLDTGEANDAAISPWQTLRFCNHCANMTHAESEAARDGVAPESLQAIRDGLASLPPGDEVSH